MAKYIVIKSDIDPYSPREDDNLGTMVCFHSGYNLGDKDHSVYLEDKYDETRKRWTKVPMLDDTEITDKDFIILPLYLYDHSGITMNTTGFSCQWDSGQVGIIFISKEKAREEYSWKYITKARQERIENYLKGEVETYDQFLRGDIYGFVCHEDGVEKDSCWGFYGDDITTNGMIDNIGKEFYEGATIIREHLGETMPDEDDEAA